MGTTSARLFFAARPEPGVLDELKSCQQCMKREPWHDRVRWAGDRNLHLTLKFLGDTPRDRIPEIVSYVREQLTLPELVFQISDITLFPNNKRPTVIAAMISDNQSLSQLAARLNRSMEHFGFKPEKRNFSPHITLGRCKKGFPRGLDLAGYVTEPIAGYMDDVILYESVTRAEGAEYKELASFGSNRD